ncbi:hypothetical protein E2320_019138, partial [Naja naja]
GNVIRTEQRLFGRSKDYQGTQTHEDGDLVGLHYCLCLLGHGIYSRSVSEQGAWLVSFHWNLPARNFTSVTAHCLPPDQAERSEQAIVSGQ